MKAMTNIVEPLACKVLQICQENDGEVTFRVASDIVPQHGQFLQLSLPKVGEAPISVSAFGAGWLEFTVRAVGRVTDQLFALKPGENLFLRGAYGKGWPMAELLGKPLVMITGGTGIAPVRSILQEALQKPTNFPSLHLVSGFRDYQSVLFKEELPVWSKAFSCLYTLDNEEQPGFAQGFVTQHLQSIPFATLGGSYQVLVVGPPAMMHFTSLGLLQLGVPEESIWLSFERKMSCAVGKCGHCRIDEVYVCLEGPVFNYTVAKGLID